MSDVPRKGEPTPDEIRQDLARTRRELSDTAEALAHKANVPARAREKASEVRAAAKEKAVVVKEVAAATAEEAKHIAEDVAGQTQETARKAMDGLPPELVRRLREFAEAIRERPVPFVVGAVIAVIVLRRVVRGRRS
jgi:F0F1-type ATP synthase membrane subunit b/b'